MHRLTSQIAAVKMWCQTQACCIEISLCIRTCAFSISSGDGKYEMTKGTKAAVYYNGKVKWEPPASFKSSCDINVKYFPFDEQFCKLKFGSWTYDRTEVGLLVAFTDLLYFVEHNCKKAIFSCSQKYVVYVYNLCKKLPTMTL